MIGFLKKFLGFKTPPQLHRVLSHPRDLQPGDILKFGYLSLPDVSQKSFEVIQVNTYLYDSLFYPEFVLKDATGKLLYMMVEEEDGEEYFGLSKKIPKALMEELLSPQSTDSLCSSKKSIKIEKIPSELRGWVVTQYLLEDENVVGSFIKGNARTLSAQEINQGEKFTSFIFEDRSSEYAIEIEEYATHEIEFCATTYHDFDVIEELWPVKAQEQGEP